MTPEEGLRKQIEILRGMTGKQRLEIACQLYDTARALVRANVRNQHRDWTDDLVEQEVTRRCRLAAGIPEGRP